jgi:hypothetical protein
MRVLTAILLLIALATGSCRTADGQDLLDNMVVPLVDHRAGIKRAVVLSDAYWFDSPPRARTLRDIEVHDVYAAVRAENDWTARPRLPTTSAP